MYIPTSWRSKRASASFKSREASYFGPALCVQSCSRSLRSAPLLLRSLSAPLQSGANVQAEVHIKEKREERDNFNYIVDCRTGQSGSKVSLSALNKPST